MPELIDPTDPCGGGEEIGIVEPVPDPHEKNCEDLKAKSQNSNFRVKMIELNNDANGTAEAGMVMFKNSPNYSPKEYGSMDSNGYSYVALTYDSSRASEVTGFTHCHLNNPLFKCAAVFSLSDIVTFADLAENSNVFVYELTMYVTSNKGTFAVKVKNKQSLLNLRNYIKDNGDNVTTQFQSKVRIDDSPERQIKGFLEFLKKQNISDDIQLYQNDGNFQNPNSVWQRKYLDEDNKVKSQNCS